MIPGIVAGRPVIGGGGGGGDPYWGNVVSLLHFEGADGSTTFTDQRGRTWTRTGDTQIDTAQFKYGAASCLFDGVGDTITTPNTTDLQVGASDFTIEAWVRPATTSGNAIVLAKHSASEGEWIVYRSGTTMQFYATSGGGTWNIANGITIGTVAAGNWYHVAVARSGSNIRTFLDGVAGDTATSALPIATTAQVLRLGGNVATDFYSGWIDEFRLTKGVARYTSNFTPPASQFPDS